ncbi:MAG TPA: hypothetical protein EYG04_02575 [Candidatus Poseidoniales archaeon]|nr:hypothetical protein [Candidatus Poseidoniales archaeon]
MSETAIPDLTQGSAEPELSRIILTLMGVGIIALMGLFSVVFGWDSFPVLGNLVPFFELVGEGGIWYYMAGIAVAGFLLLSSMAAEVLGD